MESNGGSDKYGAGEGSRRVASGFEPRVLPEPGETLTDRINRELAARGVKDRIVMIVDDPIAQDRMLAKQMTEVHRMFRRELVRHVDEITPFKFPNPEREAAAQAKRDRKNAARLKQSSAGGKEV